MFAMDPREKSVICARLPPGRWEAMTWVERLVCLREAAAAAEAKGQAEEEAKRQGAATSSVEQEHSGSTLGLGWNTGLGFRL